MANEPTATKRRVEELERELASAREALRREQPAPDGPVPSSTQPPAVSAWWVLGVVLICTVAFAVVSPFINPPLVPQRALETGAPLPEPPTIEVPGPGERDPFGRMPGSEHYGHDHPIEEDE